ncbi:MAG: cytidine deaminase [Coxiella sp. (in: Bacteria)]|nr:MAG: cytidine deaminase [Coxiella sp. (in: g-proteobacteria)]
MSQVPQDLLDAARAVLNNSYSPYSHFKVACALRAANGDIFAGCNVENGSYSVVLCGESSAIAAMVSAGQQQIAEVLLLVDAPELASPCGACRQRLSEFSNADTVVHMCTSDGLYDQQTMSTLLPFAFKLDQT